MMGHAGGSGFFMSLRRASCRGSLGLPYWTVGICLYPTALPDFMPTGSWADVLSRWLLACFGSRSDEGFARRCGDLLAK